MNGSSLLSSEASLSSSDSHHVFSNFDKLKPYEFEPRVSDYENTDSSQLCKQRKLKKKGREI